jgi:hypothetical protein
MHLPSKEPYLPLLPSREQRPNAGNSGPPRASWERVQRTGEGRQHAGEEELEDQMVEKVKSSALFTCVDHDDAGGDPSDVLSAHTTLPDGRVSHSRPACRESAVELSLFVWCPQNFVSGENVSVLFSGVGAALHVLHGKGVVGDADVGADERTARLPYSLTLLLTLVYLRRRSCGRVATFHRFARSGADSLPPHRNTVSRNITRFKAPT